MKNRVSALEGRFDSMEETLEEILVELRGMARNANRDRGRQKINCDRGRRRNQSRSSEGSRNSVNAERELRPPENSKDEAEEDRGDVQRSWMKHIAKVEKFFDLQNMTEREKMKLVYICMERGASYYWIRFWRKKTRHPNWKIFTEALTRRFDGLNRDTVCEELAAERQEGSVDKDIQELGILVPQASGKPDHSSFSVSVDIGASIISGVEVVGAIERRSDTYLIGDQLDLGDNFVERKLDENILSSQERRVRDWHFAHLEHDCAASLNNVSLSYWNLDEVYRSFGGDHCMIKRGHSFVVEYLGEGITIPLNHVVTNVLNDIKESGQNYKIKVSTANGNDFLGDTVLVTVLLGYLKAGTIQFYPPLPQWKCFSGKRFSYGTLNTVVLEFPSEVWDYARDYFEVTYARRNSRGHYFIALGVGKVAIDGQSWSSTDHLEHALKDSIPDPITYVVTDWDTVWGAMMSGLHESVSKMDVLSTRNEYIAEVRGLEIRDKLYLFQLGATCLASLGKMKVDWWQLSIKIEQEEWKTSVEDSRSRMLKVDRIQEEWKTMEEDLPPKPLDRGALHQIRVPYFNLEDKVDFEEEGNVRPLKVYVKKNKKETGLFPVEEGRLP
ncbi:hypothetical protein V8G54_012687 [Vigna mungo]|uniref:Amine oxidase domain-containing protein n=1 Tax=Vigna mungo TaxID=3915 RepID=A0AAQ3S426_VIGMU